MAALSVQARGRSGLGLHTGLLSGRVNTLGSVLNKCHSQRGRSRPSPPARLHADNPSQNPCWSDPAVACGSGVGKAGEERSRIVQAVVSMAVQVTQVFGCVFAKSHMKSLFMLQSFDVRVDNIKTFQSLLKLIKKKTTSMPVRLKGHSRFLQYLQSKHLTHVVFLHQRPNPFSHILWALLQLHYIQVLLGSYFILFKQPLSQCPYQNNSTATVQSFPSLHIRTTTHWSASQLLLLYLHIYHGAIGLALTRASFRIHLHIGITSCNNAAWNVAE